MKNKVLLLALLCYGTFASAQPTAAQIKNNIQKGILSGATVYISAQFNLDSSLMFWASDSASKSCRGVLIEGYKMAAPVSCFQKTGYRLNSLYYTLSNGQQIIDDPKSLKIKGDLAYVSLANVKSSLESLPLLSVNSSVSKKEIAPAFQNFLKEHKVQHKRHGRNRTVSSSDSTLRVGSALLYNGRVVALAKEKINSYRGDLPFDILAFF